LHREFCAGFFRDDQPKRRPGLRMSRCVTLANPYQHPKVSTPHGYLEPSLLL